MKSKPTRHSESHTQHRKQGSPREDLAESTVPAGESGSIEQHLDMNERGSLRGEEIEHFNKRDAGLFERDENYNDDMAEESREGDELSGDEHSSGHQGGESVDNRLPPEWDKEDPVPELTDIVNIGLRRSGRRGSDAAADITGEIKPGRKKGGSSS